MPFSQFKSVAQVIEKYPTEVKEEHFISKNEIALPGWFLDNLNFSIETKPVETNEFFLCEFFIAPFLQLTWKNHRLVELWSHYPLSYDDELRGEPDYLIASVPKGKISKFINQPLLALVEAKKENFTEGWGQCLAEMIACQKINQDEGKNVTVYGVVTTGIIWEFGKLENEVFTREAYSFSINHPEEVMGILDFIFEECEKQV